jgi:AcrR family transcriptional regulator
VTRTVANPAPRHRRQANESPKRRDRELLQAATKVFYERGYADSSVQDVADELGILKGSLYHYIKTKEDLLFRLLDETHGEVDRILHEVQALEGLEPLQRLDLYLHRQLTFHIAALERVAVCYRDVDQLSEARRQSIFARRRLHEQFVVSLLEQAQAVGLVSEDDDPLLLSRSIFATIIWTHQWYRPGRHTADQVADLCTGFALSGIGANPLGEPVGVGAPG